MAVSDWNLLEETRRINHLFKQRNAWFPPADERRTLLNRYGVYVTLRKMNSSQVKNLVRGQAVAAVDGSRIEYGSIYPYSICLMQALARSTDRAISNGKIKTDRVLCPLDPDLAMEIKARSEMDKVDESEAFGRLQRENLARMELQLAVRAVELFRPYMLMLDGGFLMFDRHPEWQKLIELVRDMGTILVAVIEEVATAELFGMCGMSVPGGQRVYDREFLYGVLGQGEAFVLSGEFAIKRDYITVFARMGSGLQAIACDFLAEQEHIVTDTMHLLYTITPNQGRGIPAWLDMVDREVRISRKNLETLILSGLDRDIREKYLKPNRERRGL